MKVFNDAFSSTENKTVHAPHPEESNRKREKKREKGRILNLK